MSIWSRCSYFYVIQIATPDRRGAIVRTGSNMRASETMLMPIIDAQIRAGGLTGIPVITITEFTDEGISKLFYDLIEGERMDDARIERICTELRRAEPGAHVVNMRRASL